MKLRPKARTINCPTCGAWLTCNACGDWEQPHACRATSAELECRHCYATEHPFKPGDRIVVVPFERGPLGRWWTVPWHLGFDGGSEVGEHDMILGPEEAVLVRGKTESLRFVVNRKAGGYDTAAVPEGPFTVKRWLPRETWMEAAVQQQRRALWHPILAEDPVRPSSAPTVQLVEAPIWHATFGAAWFMLAPLETTP